MANRPLVNDEVCKFYVKTIFVFICPGRSPEHLVPWWPHIAQYCNTLLQCPFSRDTFWGGHGLALPRNSFTETYQYYLCNTHPATYTYHAIWRCMAAGPLSPVLRMLAKWYRFGSIVLWACNGSSSSSSWFERFLWQNRSLHTSLKSQQDIQLLFRFGLLNKQLGQFPLLFRFSRRRPNVSSETGRIQVSESTPSSTELF